MTTINTPIESEIKYLAILDRNVKKKNKNNLIECTCAIFQF